MAKYSLVQLVTDEDEPNFGEHIELGRVRDFDNPEDVPDLSGKNRAWLPIVHGPRPPYDELTEQRVVSRDVEFPTQVLISATVVPLDNEHAAANKKTRVDEIYKEKFAAVTTVEDYMIGTARGISLLDRARTTSLTPGQEQYLDKIGTIGKRLFDLRSYRDSLHEQLDSDPSIDIENGWPE